MTHFDQDCNKLLNMLPETLVTHVSPYQKNKCNEVKGKGGKEGTALYCAATDTFPKGK